MTKSTATALRDEGSRTQVLISGATAGLVSRFCIAPLDVVKIRLQLHGPTTAARTALGTLHHILATEGLPALWKGNVPAEALYLAYGAAQFLTYRTATAALHDAAPHLPPSATSFVAGALAGTAATGLTYPLDLLRTRFAAQGVRRVYASLGAGVGDIWAREGPRGFFRGLGAGVAQIVPYMGLFFAAYEGLKPVCCEGPLGGGEAVAGVGASVLSKTAVFPLDTVRKRLQVQGPTREGYVGGNVPVYEKGVVGTIRAIVAREGARGLYRGLPVSLVKAAPASAVTVWTYEKTMGLLQSME